MKKKNRNEEAVALRYDTKQDQVPVVIAKGKGDLAEKIIASAKEQQIPIQKDKDLVEILLKLKLGAEVPEDLYAVVAELLSFIYDLEDLA